jgi:teichuronic acid biosynthesis glycosyltransferase TuaC
MTNLMDLRVLSITNIYPNSARPWLGTFVEQQVKGLELAGVQMRVLYFDRKEAGPFIYYRMGPRLDEALRSFNPDLIHVMYGGVMAEKITKLCGKRPVVVTFHGSDLLGENLSGPLRKAVSHYGVRCSRAAARRAHGIVVVARHLELELPREVDRRKVRVIPCGVDLSRFRPMAQDECRQRLGWSPGKFHVLFPSNTGDPVKRPWLAQAAVQELDKFGVQAELHMLSGVPYSEVPFWLNASDVLILTSLHEGSPTVVKEALACKIPVVSVDVGDVQERLEGVEGCYLSAPEARELAAKLCAVWKCGRKLENLPCLQALSIQSIAERLKKFYFDSLQQSERAPSADAVLSA